LPIFVLGWASLVRKWEKLSWQKYGKSQKPMESVGPPGDCGDFLHNLGEK